MISHARLLDHLPRDRQQLSYQPVDSGVQVGGFSHGTYDSWGEVQGRGDHHLVVQFHRRQETVFLVQAQQNLLSTHRIVGGAGFHEAALV